MKRFFPLMAALGLAACAGSHTTSAQAEIRKNQDGSEYGVCILPDGKEVEEWAYYRANNK